MNTSQPHIHPYALGASLYIPGTHPQLAQIIHGQKYPHMRSCILCTEDAILAHEVPLAIRNIQQVMQQPAPSQLNVFVRPRNPEVLQELLQQDGLKHVMGVVLPKVQTASLAQWWNVLQHTPHLLMPTLETRDVFDTAAMQELRSALDQYQDRILMLRIGGNDLLNFLGIRRVSGNTLYHTPLGTLVSQLVMHFKPFGYHLSAPVYDVIDDVDTLVKETLQDVQHGLFAKTAIHPSHIAPIEQQFKVTASELEMAQAIVNAQQAVFKLHNAMCEPSTHTHWALNILERHRSYGLRFNPSHMLQSTPC